MELQKKNVKQITYCERRIPCNSLSNGCNVCICLQCRDGYAGDGTVCGLDPDLDGSPAKNIFCSELGCAWVGEL